MGEDKCRERATAHEFHHDEEVWFEAVADKGDEVDVIDLRECHNLPCESFEAFLVNETYVRRDEARDEDTRSVLTSCFETKKLPRSLR